MDYIQRLSDAHQRLAPLRHLVSEVLAETLWPTRCALCDRPGHVLCDACISQLPYLDWWRACRRCGAAYGYVQCDACNPLMLAKLDRESLPFEGCMSAVDFTDATGRIVRTFKDKGEQRLADVMACQMMRALPPQWTFDALTWIPASLAAYRHRGFDHAELLARSLASKLDAPCAGLLMRPKTKDQRALSKQKRVSNLASSFHAYDTALPSRVLLVDDVFTTGSTLCAATDALRAAGCSQIYCTTYARVP